MNLHRPEHWLAISVLFACGTAHAQDDCPIPKNGATPRPAAAAAASSYDVTILHVNFPAHPTNVVPGLAIPFTAGGGSTAAFQRPAFSQNGTQWVIECNAATGSTTTDNIYLRNDVVVAQEGTPATWAPVGELVGTLDDTVAINDSGAMLFGNNTGGTAPATADDYMVFIDPGGIATSLAKEGDLVDPILPAIAGATWDDTMDSPVLTNAGLFGWSADGIDGTVGGLLDDDLVHLGTVIIAQEGVTIPAGQAGGGMAFWENFDLDDFYVSADGTTILIQGDTDAATTDDQVLVLNGTVVIQENQILAGSAFAEPVDASGIVKGWLDSGNNWYARGNNDVTEQDWVVRNGVVVAFSDGMDELTPGSGEYWDDTDYGDCFFAFDGNSSGAYVIGGVTNAPSTANGVLLLVDGMGFRRVVARENDPVDIDGNGLFDDDRYFNTFGNDDVLLLEDGSVVFVATLRNGAGTATDQGFFRLDPATAACAFRNGSGINPADYACTNAPVLGTTWMATIAVNANTLGTTLAMNVTPNQIPFDGQEILIDVVPTPILYPGGATYAFPIPNLNIFLGAEIYSQGIRVDSIGGVPTLVLLNALDLRFGR